MRKPSATQSLAPAGFVFPYYQSRLKVRRLDELHYIGREMLIAKLWEKLNRINAIHPLPMHTILHDILPKKLGYKTKGGDFYFDGHNYMSRDACIVNTIVQWFATNCGHSFLSRYECIYPRIKVERTDYYQAKYIADDRHGKMETHWTHSCTPECYNSLRYDREVSPHVFDRKSVTERDRAVIKSVMQWLDTEAGNAFVKTWFERWDRAYKIMNNEANWKYKLKRILTRMAAA